MFMEPMLMTQRDDAFDDPDYLFEPLIDGQRLQLSFIGSRARLFTRHGNEVTKQYPELLNVPLKLPADVVLDGEVAYLDPASSEFQFDRLIDRYQLKKQPRIRDAVKETPLRFFVFDILYYEGTDMRSRPLRERKRLLEEVLLPNSRYGCLPYIEGEGRRMYEVARQLKLEGIACKRADSLYSPGKSEDWHKVLNYKTEQAAVLGWRKHRPGLLVGFATGQRAVVEAGWDEPLRRKLETSDVQLGEDHDFVYVKPGSTASLKFISRRRDGRLVGGEVIELNLTASHTGSRKKRSISALNGASV
ncbi:ATP-dependent DNA ligase [Paenibacillus radicis (ex Gao et al. 2016)]|uniref:ATP-dependent DNA ligase n=1 Tax=Paenibacillus radicis (ex Gao et al. 2016) TaxID=1737354 RepID=A0A917LSK4_9BACL|nr:ATP-dependent DNA ligase [Paenibacillus radicis (ex Gao et al. 2016)]GGG55255.1 ATP-dependent DNA ligase [Paenibacillus radicis (ex Gao et al. 2016)]